MILDLLFVLAGAYLLGTALAWRLRSTRVTGTLIGVRPRGTNSYYYVVYRCVDAMGRTFDASCSDLSPSLAGKQTGLTRQLLILAGQPVQARAANSVLLELGGVGSLLFGVLMAWPDGSTAAGIDVVLGSLLGWYAFKRKAGTGAKNEASPAAVVPEAAPVQRAEDILATSEAARRAVRKQRGAGPFIAVIGFTFLAVAAFALRSIARLEVAGLRAPGVVLQLVRSSQARASFTYRPVVQFTTASGASVQFEDGFGSNPSQYHIGDHVQVLYFADAAPSSASIDRGIGNWTLPFAFGFLGAGLIVLGLRQRAAARSVQELLIESTSSPAPVGLTLNVEEEPVHTPVAAQPEPLQGVTIRPLDPRLGRRIGWVLGCFVIGWCLWFASNFVPSPNSAKGLGPVLLMIAPGFGALLLFVGQSLAIVMIIVRTVARLAGNSQTSVSRAVDGSAPAGPLARALDGMGWLTCVLVMMAGGCVLIAIGLAAQVAQHLTLPHGPT